jgi:hypothetical protein
VKKLVHKGGTKVVVPRRGSNPVVVDGGTGIVGEDWNPGLAAGLLRIGGRRGRGRWGSAVAWPRKTCGRRSMGSATREAASRGRGSVAARDGGSA